MSDVNSKKKIRLNYTKIRNKVVPQVGELILKKAIQKIRLMQKNKELNGYLGIYWPLTGEVDLRSLKRNLNLPLALPATTKEGLLSYHQWSNSPLRNDYHGIPAPLDEPPLEAKELSLLLVPAIAIDKNGYRLGYGGGFFDRLRSKKNWYSIPSLVVLPEACVSQDPLPRDSWDIPFNGWINEAGDFRASHPTTI